jgi:hypothetical protein
MQGLGLSSAAVLVGASGFALVFRRLQNKGAWVGGEISWPKAFWLAYAIGAWYLAPLAFVLDPAVALPLKWVLGLHALVWWIRAPIELVMIYRLFNWTPVYGISHDAIHNVALFGATSWACGVLGWDAILGTEANLWAFVFLCTTCFALIAEAVFAALFLVTRGQGQKKIYFAADSPEYRLINRLTLTVCLIVYAQLIAQSFALAF